MKDLKPGEQAKIWLPVPVDTAEQTIAIDKKELPGKEQIGKEPQYGNTMLYVEGKANDKGEIPFKVVYKVTRHEVKTDVKANLVLKPKEPEAKITPIATGREGAGRRQTARLVEGEPEGQETPRRAIRGGQGAL